MSFIKECVFGRFTLKQPEVIYSNSRALYVIYFIVTYPRLSDLAEEEWYISIEFVRKRLLT